jgi:glycosyltransferase involved in cell wall biosynthesis
VDTAPEISVVVASFSGPERLRACLLSVLPQAAGQEVIVARGGAPGGVASLKGEFAGVRFIEAEAGASVFRLRTVGVEQARGPVVALLEDHCVASSKWLEAILHAFGDGRAVVGGTVVSGARTLYGWALFCCEYLAFMPPLPSGAAETLSGVNAAYRRDALDAVRPAWAQEFRENEVHDALRARGHALYRESAAQVQSNLDMPLPAAMLHLYGGGRHFASFRHQGATALQRVARTLLAPAVPVVLLGRILRQAAWRGRRDLIRMLLALPFIVVLTVAWSAGEGVGYLAALLGRRAG